MELIENYSLKKHNSFVIEAHSKYFANCRNIKELKEVLELNKEMKLPFLILGGGSNILFTKQFEGIVIKTGLLGINKLGEDDNCVQLKVAAGEEWDGFVNYCVECGYRGVENLSYIPGSVGSCPIQNIGAYGMEVKETIESVEFVNMETGELKSISNAQCNFGYRDSIFKHELKGKVVITAVTFTLSKKSNFLLSYGNVSEELKNYPEISLFTVRDAIIQIRKRKLPDPSILGNAGSFFKNPVIPATQAIQIKKIHPQLPHFVHGQRKVKIPAAWLIEQCGWKGKRAGDAGVHERQALVIVNYGKASGTEILNLAKAVKKSVKEKFGIELEFEVNIY